MNKILPIASLALIVGGLNAQGTTMTVTGTVTAKAHNTSVNMTTGKVTYSRYVYARDGKSWWRPNASASKSVRHYVSKYSGRSYASVSDYASAKATYDAKTLGAGTIDVTIKAAKKGSLVYTWYSRGTATLAVTGTGYAWAPTAKKDKQTHTITVGAPATISFSVNSSVDAGATKTASGYASSSFSAVFIPEVKTTKCTITKGKVAGCKGGGALSGTPSSKTTWGRHVITLKLAGASANSWYINLMGKADKANPMANKCMLLDGPMWAGFGRTDKSGNSTSRLYVSATKSISAWMQSAVLDFGKGFSLKTSNTLGISCK